jgi:hypothetical protein
MNSRRTPVPVKHFAAGPALTRTWRPVAPSSGLRPPSPPRARQGFARGGEGTLHRHAGGVVPSPPQRSFGGEGGRRPDEGEILPLANSIVDR